MRAFLNWHNVGNIRLAVNAGTIDSQGDGIRAGYVTPHDDNGSIAVTVAEGARVTGAVAGIYVANAGTGLRIEKKYTSPAVQDANQNLGADDLVTLAGYPDQVVRVQGEVVGGTDAAVHLVVGGALIVTGAGKLVAGSSGRAVLVNDPGPAVIYIEGEVTGGAGPESAPAPAAVHLTGGGSVTVGLTGRVRAGGAMSAIRGDEDTSVTLHAARNSRELQDWISRESADGAAGRVEGLIIGAGTTAATFREYQDGVGTGHRVTVPLKDGRPDTSGLRAAVYPDPPEGSGGEDMGGSDRETPDTGQTPSAAHATFDCDDAMDGRCRLYEALPSILLAMSATGPPPGTSLRRSTAARDARGTWARIDVGGGEWKAESSTTRPNLAYDRQRYVMHAGVETRIADAAWLGVSAHGLRGRATLAEGNAAKLSGVGGGAYATVLASGFHLDVRAAAARYDVDLASAIHGPLASGVSGVSHTLGVEVGRRMTAAADVSITPHVGLAWSRISLDDFTDQVRTQVSVERAESLSGRLGAAVEAPLGGSGSKRAFATLDAAHEFSGEMETVVEGQILKASRKPTSLRFGLGGLFALDARTRLRVAMGYETGGSTRAFDGGLNLAIRF